LQRLYQLSDPQAESEVADRLSFRDFLDLRAGDRVPDETTLVKFRARLREHGMLEAIYLAIEEQLATRGMILREGAIKIVDATLVRAATCPPRRIQGASHAVDASTHQPALDPDADFTGAGGRAHYGYKLHIAQDAASGLITRHWVSPASTGDVQIFTALLEGTEREVLADKGYHSAAHRRWLRDHGVHSSIMYRAARAHPLSAWKIRRNKSIARVRGRIETAFATLKRYLGCGRMRYRGLERCYEQMTWGILAFNLKRAVALARA
jgi:IS5 family transposase